MREQQVRDEVTLTIASTLLLFASLLAGVALALWGIGALVGDDTFGGAVLDRWP